MSADLQPSKNWFGVAKSNSHVDKRGNIIVTSTHSGHEDTLRTPANAAQASIIFTRVDKLRASHSSAVTDEYLNDPTKLMKLYLEVIKFLSDWGYLQPALFRASVLSQHTIYFSVKHPSGKVYVNTVDKKQPYLDPQDDLVPESFKILFGKARQEAEAQASARGHTPPESPNETKSPKSAPSGLDTSATPGKNAEGTGDNTGHDDVEGKTGGKHDEGPPSEDPLEKFEGGDDFSEGRETIFVNANRDVVGWDRHQYHVGQALAQQADLFFMSLFNSRETDVGLEFLVHEQQLRATGEPICIVTALVFVHHLISTAMSSTNYHNKFRKTLDDFQWNSNSTEFWREWLFFSGQVSEYEDMTGRTYNKIGQFVVALKERFNAYRLQWKSKGGDHPWHHLHDVFRPLRGEHDDEIGRMSTQSVVNFVRQVQEEHAKEISDGAGNRIIDGDARANRGTKRSVMFAEDTNGPSSSDEAGPVQFTFSVGESRDPEQLVQRFRTEINTWSNSAGRDRGRGAGGGGRGSRGRGSSGGGRGAGKGGRGSGKGQGKGGKGKGGRDTRRSQACRDGYYCLQHPMTKGGTCPWGHKKPQDEATTPSSGIQQDDPALYAVIMTKRRESQERWAAKNQAETAQASHADVAFVDMAQYGQDESSEMDSDSGDENFLVEVAGPNDEYEWSRVSRGASSVPVDGLGPNVEGEWSHVSNARSASPVPLEDFPDEGAALSAVDRDTDVDGGVPEQTHDDLESVQAGARSAYAFYHFAELGSIGDAEVGRSSAGVQGWFEHHMHMSRGDEADPEYLSFCGAAATADPTRQDTAADEPEDLGADAVHRRHETSDRLLDPLMGIPSVHESRELTSPVTVEASLRNLQELESLVTSDGSTAHADLSEAVDEHASVGPLLHAGSDSTNTDGALGDQAHACDVSDAGSDADFDECDKDPSPGDGAGGLCQSFLLFVLGVVVAIAAQQLVNTVVPVHGSTVVSIHSQSSWYQPHLESSVDPPPPGSQVAVRLRGSYVWEAPGRQSATASARVADTVLLFSYLLMAVGLASGLMTGNFGNTWSTLRQDDRRGWTLSQVQQRQRIPAGKVINPGQLPDLDVPRDPRDKDKTYGRPSTVALGDDDDWDWERENGHMHEDRPPYHTRRETYELFGYVEAALPNVTCRFIREMITCGPHTTRTYDMARSKRKELIHEGVDFPRTEFYEDNQVFQGCVHRTSRRGGQLRQLKEYYSARFGQVLRRETQTKLPGQRRRRSPCHLHTPVRVGQAWTL